MRKNPNKRQCSKCGEMFPFDYFKQTRWHKKNRECSNCKPFSTSTPSIMDMRRKAKEKKYRCELCPEETYLSSPEAFWRYCEANKKKFFTQECVNCMVKELPENIKVRECLS
jgi:hypothetical protein